MNRITHVARWSALAAGIVMLAAPVRAGGLSTSLGEVVIENLQLGQTYNLKDLANLSLTVSNNSDLAVDLQMDVLVPAESELRYDAHAIPDAAWIDLSQQTFSLSAGAQAVADVYITIPNHVEHLGQLYQFHVWSHTIVGPGAGMALAYGLKSRILFSIDTVVAEPAQAETSEADGLIFAVTPPEIHVEDVVIGAPCDVAQQSGHVLTISNPGPTPQTVRLQSQRVADSRAVLTPGYEDTPDAAYLTFSDRELIIPPGESSSVQLYLDFPDQPQHKGRDYMFIINAQTVETRVSTGVYSRLYASVR